MAGQRRGCSRIRGSSRVEPEDVDVVGVEAETARRHGDWDEERGGGVREGRCEGALAATIIEHGNDRDRLGTWAMRAHLFGIFARSAACGPRDVGGVVMLPTTVSIYLALSPVDLRKGFDLLSGLVKEQLGGDARTGDLFLFLNKARTRLKALFYDRTGYCILYKRLDRGTFPLPVVIAPGSTRVEVSPEQLEILLQGIDLPEGTRSRGALHEPM
jgi:transposase